MENNLKFNSSVCTTVEQSQRLLSLGLKPETADMYHSSIWMDGKAYPITAVRDKSVLLSQDTPAWSLHRLIELYKEVEEISLWSLENVNYNYLIQCISLAIKHNSFNKEYLKGGAE